jgi:PPP family 3-phenylpropionic acid transporter
MPKSDTLGVRLSVLYAASFISIGVYLAFFPVWLESKALDPSLIGLIVAIPIVVRIVLTAPLLVLADRSLGPKRLLIASHAGQIASFPLLLVIDSGWAIATVAALAAAAQVAVMPGNDLVTTEAVRRHGNLDYGRIRVWGSVAFLGATIGTGYLVDLFGPEIVVWALVLAPFLGILATLLALPAGTRAESPPAQDRGARRGQSFPPALWLIMIVVAVAQSSHGALYAFGSIHWRSVGFSDAAVGYLWAVGVAAEIALFAVLGRVVGRGSLGIGLLMVGCAAVVVRFAGLALDPDPVTTFLLQALHGLTFGATHLGGMAALTALTPAGARGRAQGILAALLALGMAVATIASGPLYRAWGAGVFAAMAPLGVIGMVLTLLVARRMRAHPQSTGEGG